MAAPILVAGLKWAGTKIGSKTIAKAGNSEGGAGKTILGVGAAGIGFGAIMALSIVMAMIGMLLALFSVMSAIGAGGAAGAVAASCLVDDDSPSALALRDIPPVALDAYNKAGTKSGVPWYYIAAIGKVETDHGRFGGRHLDDNGDVKPTPIYGPQTKYGRAEGVMQFLDATFKAYARDGDNDSDKDPQNVYDAALTAGVYLKANGAPRDMQRAIFAYNHAQWYVDKVLKQAQQYRSAANSTTGGDVATGGGTPPPSQIGENEIRLVAANIKQGIPLAQHRDDVRKAISRAPDFIAFQEVGFRKMDDITPNGYATFRGKGNGYQRENAVSWRTDRWKVLDTGVTLGSMSRLKWAERYITWATLEERRTGRIVSVLSIHALTSPWEPARQPVMAQWVANVNALVQRLGAKGTVVMAGDVNTSYKRDSKQRLPGFPYAGLKASDMWSTFQMLGNYFPTHGRNTIDWLWVRKTDGARALRHGRYPMYSDHDGIWADFRLPAAGVGGIGATGAINRNATPAVRAAAQPVANTANPDIFNLDDGRVYPLKKGTYTFTARWGQAGSYWSSGYHTGLDFAAPTGTGVYAAKTGTVRYVDGNRWAGTNFVTIDHGGGLVTWYAHMSTRLVRNGQKVNAGDHIGNVGAEGNVTGPHLHFEVRVNGKDIDPLGWLSGAGVPSGNAASDDCGPTGTSGEVGANGQWGGHQNGKIPLSAMCKLNFEAVYLECNAADALNELNTAYQKRFKQTVGPVGGYRSYEAQVICQQQKGNLCAKPGTSNHGWGLAADLSGGGINTFGTPQHRWMAANAPRFGWVLPKWAQAGGSKPEPWHWEYVGTGNNPDKA